MVARPEVRVVAGTQMRMDVVVYTAMGKLWIDVSVVNPLAASMLSSKDPISDRERVKRQKWSGHAEQLGAKFMPFALNVYGGLGVAAHCIIGLLANGALRAYPYARVCSKPRWLNAHRAQSVQRIVAALAHLNELSVEEAVTKASGVRARNLFKGIQQLAVVNS